MSDPTRSIKAALPCTREVCGISIPPLSALHIMALEELDSGFLVKGAKLTNAETILALYVLSRPVNEIARLVHMDREDVEAEAMRIVGVALRMPDVPLATHAILDQIRAAYDPLPRADDSEAGEADPLQNFPAGGTSSPPVSG